MTCPSVVFCLGPAGERIGASLASASREWSTGIRPSVWILGGCAESARAHALPRGALGEDAPAGALSELVADVLARVLGVGDPDLAVAMQRPIALRVLVVAGAWELDAAFVEALAVTLRVAARRHVGIAHLTEACILLPPWEAGDADPPAGLRLFDVCWWLDRINAGGQALPALADAGASIAALLGGLLRARPEHFPLQHARMGRYPLSMSAGFAELTVARPEHCEVLAARRGARLVRRLFLRGGSASAADAARRRAWRFAASPACAEALRDVDRSPGGERIWKGFSRPLPAELRGATIETLIAALGGDREQFEREGLASIRSVLAHSGRVTTARIEAAIDAETQAIADDAQGGLVEALAFLEVLVTLLEPATAPEGERRLNLQDLRRTYDRDFGDAVQATAPLASAHARRAAELRQALEDLGRLADITRPPALEPEHFGSVRGGGAAAAALDQEIAEVRQQLDGAVAAWATDAARAEWEAQHGRRQAQSEEEGRRSAQIDRAEHDLRELGTEHARVASQLGRVRRRHSLQFRRRARLLRALDDQLAMLESELPLRAHALVAAHAARMQLSVDRAVYDSRDDVVRRLLGRVRFLHGRIRSCIWTLEDVEARLGGVALPTADHVLSRSILQESDLEPLMRCLGEPAADGRFPDGLTPWQLSQLSDGEIRTRIGDEAGRPVQAVLGWTLAELLRAVDLPRTRVATAQAWLYHTSQPLILADAERAEDLVIVRAPEQTDLARTLRQTLPDAIFVDDAAATSLSVLRIRTLPAGFGGGESSSAAPRASASTASDDHAVARPPRQVAHPLPVEQILPGDDGADAER